MRGGRNYIHIAYIWVVILLGFALISYYFSLVDLDYSREYLAFIALGVLAEWLAVSFPLGKLSGGFSVVLAAFLLFGTPGAAWISYLSCLVGQGVANRGNPMRTTLFNAGQQVLTLLGAAWLCGLMSGGAGISPAGGNWKLQALGLIVFVASYFIINHLLVYFYIVPVRHRQGSPPWRDAMRWDGLTYLFSAPYGVVMAMLYLSAGLGAAVLLFVPILVVQFVLRLYVRAELANKELRAMYEVVQRFSEKVDLKEIPGLLLREAARAVPYHTGVLYLRSENKGQYFAASCRGPYSTQLNKSLLRPGEGFLGFCLNQRDPVLIDDTRYDFRIKNDPGLPQVLRSMIIIPLVSELGVMGLMVLGEKRSGAYDEHNLRTLSVIGGTVSVALANNLLNRQIKVLKKRDHLTGLLHRSQFRFEASKVCQEAVENGVSIALLLVGVVQMGQFNMRHGNDAGDKALQDIAGLLEATTAAGSLLARYGGDQFALLLAAQDEARCLSWARDLRARVGRHPFEAGDGQAHIKVNIGIALLPRHGDNLEVLLVKAEDAVKVAGKLGGEGVCLFGGETGASW